MKLSAKRTNEMREMMLALTDQEGRVGMNESRSSGSGSTSETSLLKFYAEINIAVFCLASTVSICISVSLFSFYSLSFVPNLLRISELSLVS